MGVGAFIQNTLTSVPSGVVYAAVFALPFLEASIFLGFVIPGETALVVGGVLAGQGRANLGLVIALAVLGAILGDAIGYGIGRRFGPSLQASRLGQVVGDRRWSTTEAFLQRRGAPAVFFGRWTALLRALVPSAAGMAKLPYGTFALWNVLGGGLWATACVLGGYAIGDVVGRYIAQGGYVLVGLAALVLIVHLVRKRRSAGKRSTSDLSVH